MHHVGGKVGTGLGAGLRGLALAERLNDGDRALARQILHKEGQLKAGEPVSRAHTPVRTGN